MQPIQESQDGFLWEEVLLSEDLSLESGDVDEELEGIQVAVELPEDVDHA